MTNNCGLAKQCYSGANVRAAGHGPQVETGGDDLAGKAGQASALGRQPGNTCWTEQNI